MTSGDKAWRPKLILASASPRRLELLQQIGIEPDALLPVDLDETPRKNELPRTLAARLAAEKTEAAAAIARRTDRNLPSAYIIGADTVVSVGRRILPKCEIVAEAAQSLRLLSGRAHRVHTGCLPHHAKGPRRATSLSRRGCASSGYPRARSRLISDLANGVARPAAMRSRVLPALSPKNSLDLIPRSSVCRFTRPCPCLSGEGFPAYVSWLNRV